MPIRIATIVLLFACSWLGHGVRAQSPRFDQEATSWVRGALSDIQTVSVGMTRSQLLALFETEGGAFSGLKRTYVYRRCPYIKVDVEFEAVGRLSRDADGRATLLESDLDRITKISRPYLAWGVVD